MKKEYICIDFVNKKAIFIGEFGDFYFSKSLYEIGESEVLEKLNSISVLPLNEQLEIKNAI